MTKDKAFRIDSKNSDGSIIKGHIIYHGMQMYFSINRQKSGKYRGRITVISPMSGKIMKFEQNRPYAKSGSKKVKKCYIEFNLDSIQDDVIRKTVVKKAEKIYADNGILFRAEQRQATNRDTIAPEIAGHLYAEEFVYSQFFKVDKESKQTANIKKLKGILASLPNKPMKDIAPSGVDRVLRDKKTDRVLLHRFWAFCILRDYCSGSNPVRPEHDISYPQKLQAKLDKIVSAPENVMTNLSRQLLDRADGTACGVALMASGFSSEFVCSLHWQDVCWPTDDQAFAIITYYRPEMLCAVHNYTRPVLPITALTLFKRREELLCKKNGSELRILPVASLKTQLEKAMSPSALKQESKQYLIDSGIKKSILSSNGLDDRISVSATVLLETYKKTLVKTCGIDEESGTYAFLLGHYINDVTSANYTSFTCPAGQFRLYKYLRAAIPLSHHDNASKARKQSSGEIDSFRVLPDSTRECAGMICDFVLLPGQQFSIESETDLRGTIKVVNGKDNFENG